MRIIRTSEDRMDDNSTLSHQNGGGVGGGGIVGGGVGGGAGGQMNSLSSQQIGTNNANNINNKDDNNTSQPTTQYSIPGILHFIQHEWARFELERSQWDVDRAELQVKERRLPLSLITEVFIYLLVLPNQMATF